MANEEGNFVTKLELLNTRNEIEEKVYEKINDVDNKVDRLNDIVLPLVVSSEQTAKNTDRMAKSLDDFVKDQRRRNDNFYKKLNKHDKEIGNLGSKSAIRLEDKKLLVKIIVGLLGFAGVIAGGIFGLAPYIFN